MSVTVCDDTRGEVLASAVIFPYAVVSPYSTIDELSSFVVQVTEAPFVDGEILTSVIIGPVVSNVYVKFSFVKFVSLFPFVSTQAI